MTRLEQLRIDAGLTQSELGLRAGVLSQSISKAESGRGMSVKSLAKVARVFNVPASTLLLPALSIEERHRIGEKPPVIVEPGEAA